MSAATSLTCPECGHAATSDADLLATRRGRKSLVIAAVLLIAPLTATAFFSGYPRVKAAFTPKWQTIRTHTIGKYTIRELQARDDLGADAIEIRFGNQLFARHEGFYLAVVGHSVNASLTFGVGDDINRDGVPDLIITQGTGGTGCVERHTVYSLADPPDDFYGFRPVAVFELCGYRDDLDHDGSIEFIGRDRTFSSRWTAGGGSPYPRVIYRIAERHEAVLADDLMLAPLVTDDELEVLITEARAQTDWFSHIECVLKRFFDLIYCGNEAAAWRFYNSAFDPAHFGNPPGYAAELRAELGDALRQSPFYLAVKGLQDRRR